MSISSDYLENDYLELSSTKSREMLVPIMERINNDNMVVVACKVTVFFQTRQQGWFSQETVKSRSVTTEMTWVKEAHQACQEAKDDRLIITILKEMSPMISLIKPETCPTAVAELCKFIREEIKEDNEALQVLACANLGKDFPEIKQKLEKFSPQELTNLTVDLSQKIQNFSDPELFQFLQSLLPGFIAMAEEKEVQMSGSPNIEVSKKEIYKISNCYTQVMQEVLDKPGTKELTEIKIDVLLAKRSNVQDLISGHYQVTSKQPGEWTWKQGNQITA